MSEQPDAVPEMSDEEIVTYTQGVRRKLVKHITNDGQQMPNDKGEQMVLLAALGDMDRTALGKMKIGAKERQGAADREVALIAARLQANFGPQGPLQRPVIEGEATRVETPVLDTTDLPPLELAPGETDIGLADQNYDEFMERMEGDSKK